MGRGTASAAEEKEPVSGIMKDEIVRKGLPDAYLPADLPDMQSGSAPDPSGRMMTIAQLNGRVDAMETAVHEEALETSRRMEALEFNLKSKATAGLFLPWHKIRQLLEAAKIRPRSYLQVCRTERQVMK